MRNTNGVIAKNVADLHAEKCTDSERVTQAIMGQPVVVEKDEGDWLYVRTWDTYHGWIQSCWVSRTVPHPARVATVASLFTDALSSSDLRGDIWTKLVITTTLELAEERKNLVHIRLHTGKDAWVRELSEGQRSLVNVSLPDGQDAWVRSADLKIIPATEEELALGPTGDELVRAAKRFLGVPYLWGGTSPFGLDCSGLVQLVYRLNGTALLRDAHMQADDARAIPTEKADLVAGDLVFFAGGEDKTKITHVGMVCGEGTFIHSAGSGVGVTINSLDDEPYDRNYWGARRMEDSG